MTNYSDIELKMDGNSGVKSDLDKHELEQIDEKKEEEDPYDCDNKIDDKICAVEIDCNQNELPNKKRFRIFGYELKQIKWTNVIFLTWLHIFAVYGYIHGLVNPVRIFTVIFVSIMSIFSGLGMSVGGHRLWAHKSFKARLPLKIFLLILQSATLNGSALSYARDHRTHHKWTDKEPDPKNPSRGMFYAHIGWWLLRKKQIVKDHGKKLNFDDLYNDPWLRFQHKFYIPLAALFGFVLPTIIPWLMWGENPLTSFLLCGALRVCVILHHLFTVNSLAHYIGWRPYDRFMLPTENQLVIYLSLGEGNHNYHHTFPWDYSSSELSFWEFYNPSTFFIKCCEIIGLAYDLKKPSKELIHKVVQRKGIPEYFEPIHKRGLCLRIITGIIDWIFGAVVSLWPVFTIIAFKAATGRDMIIIDHFWEPYINWLRHFWFADNFIVYY